MVQIIPQSDLGQEIGSSLGQGLSQGANQLLSMKLQEMLSQKQNSKPFSVFETQKLLQSVGRDRDLVQSMPASSLNEITERANLYMPSLGRDQAFIQAQEDVFNPGKQQGIPQTGLQVLQDARQEPKESLWQATKKGFESGIPGRVAAIASGEGEESFSKRTGLQKKGWVRNLLHGLAKFGTDSPFYAGGGAAGAAAGTAVGGPVGAIVGGGAGALALPAMIESSLTEYQKFMDKGGKGTFGDFVKSAKQVGGDTTKAAGHGAILGPLSKFSLISKVPGGKKLLEMRGGRAAGKILDTGVQAGIFTSAVGATEGRIPSMDEYGQNLALFLGLDVLGNAGKYGKNVYSQLKKSGIMPERAGAMIKEKVVEKGYDLNNPKDVVRVVKDITAEQTRAGEIASETITETKQPVRSPRETAERLAERPIDEYLDRQRKAQERKDKPLTARETAKRETAQKESRVVKEKLDKVANDIEFLKERSESKISRQQRSMVELGLEQKQKEMSSLTKSYEDLKGISDKGRRPFRESEVREQANKRLEDLQKISLDPSSESSKKLEQDFLRDQKYVDQALKLSEKGPLPQDTYKDLRIRSLEPYQKAYKDQINKVKRLIEESPSASLSRELDLLKRNLDINSAKITSQMDKINALSQLKKPGSSLVKQHLKNLRKDIKEFQKDFVKQVKREDALKVKVDQELSDRILKKRADPGQRTLKNSDSLSQKFSKEPLDSQVNKESKKMGVSRSKLQNIVSKLKPEISDIIKEFKNDPSKGINKARQLYRKLPFKYQVAVGSLISAGLSEAGVPYYVRFWFIPSNSIIRALATGMGGVLRDKYHDLVMDSYTKKLVENREKSLGNAEQYLNNIKKKLKPKEIKEIMKKYQDITG